MAILTYPLNGITYDAEDAEVYNCTRTSGVFAEEGHFPATITGRLEISIGPGLAWIQNEEFHGKAIYNPETVALAIEEADAHLTRIDRIVLQFDKLMHQTTLEVKTGTPASKPVPPDITRSNYIYELGLYTVTVKYSTLSLSDGCIASTFMDENVCGLMRDGVTRLPTQNLYNQWYAWFVNLQNNTERFEEQLQQWFHDVQIGFESWENETKQDFEEWFDTVKDVLDENTAGRLQNEIDTLKEHETLVQGEIDTLKERVKRLEKIHYLYFAVYSEDDFSVTFYGDIEIPEAGDRYKDKNVTYVFTGKSDAFKWSDLGKICVSVSFDESFSGVRPTSMYRWFYYFTELTSIDLTNLNTCDVTTMESLFHGCRKLKAIELSPLDTGNVTNMESMFKLCNALTSIDLSPLDTGNVTNMCEMFSQCSALTTIDVSPLDTKNVKDISYIFTDCYMLESINLGHMDTRNVTNISYMFSRCISLTSLDLSQLDTSNATGIGGMFYGCERLTTIDVSSMDTSKVQEMSSMFEGCTELKIIYSDDNKFVTTSVSIIYAGEKVFKDCINLVGGNGTEYDSKKVDYNMAHVDTAQNPGYFTAKS